MSEIEDIQNSIKSELDRLGELINSSLKSSNELMNQVIEGYLKSKGKMIRPIMVILAAKLFGEVNDRVISSAAAVEMLHNASLIHDDVVDESKLRRSLPTINSLWGNHMAVLVGDFFVSSALQLAISTADIRVVEVLADLGKILSVGEVDQIYNARFHRLSEEAYLETISRKTASLFVSCVKMAGYCTDVTDERLEHMVRFAELLGLCFQIKDDVFDYYADPEIGKPTGNDLLEGKVSLPLLYALNRTELPRQKAMLELSRKESLDADDIEALIEYAKSAGGIDYAYRTMERFRSEALDELDYFGDSAVKDAFASLFAYVISRKK